MRLETSTSRVFLYACGNIRQRKYVKDYLERNHIPYCYTFNKDRFSLLLHKLTVAKFLVDEVNRTIP